MGQVDLLKQIVHRKQSLLGLFIVAVTIFSTFYAAIVAAAPLTVMSITPSSASTEAEGVSYSLTFTPDQNAGAVVIDFCDNTPLLGQSCTAPAGLDVSGATAGAGGHTILPATGSDTEGNTIFATKAGITADTPETLVFNALVNPDDADVMYARIVTYADGTAAAGYDSEDPDAAGAVVDNGSVSMYFNDTVVVQGTVLETMTFCVSGADIAPDCAGAAAPTITLGAEQGVGSGIFALVPGTVHEGSLHVQMNTNATGGAVVRLKSSATCGGLMRLGSDECNIAAAGAGPIAVDNTAKFGVKLAAATTASGASSPVGTLQPYDFGGTPFYDTTDFKLNFNDDDSVGITSVIGDPLLDTADAPATNQNMELTFGATVGTDTPAGTYSTDLSLIAVGTF